MNAKRREKLKEAINKLIEARDGIDCVREEEDDTRLNMPFNLQNSEKYDTSEECSRSMDNAITSIDEAIGAIEEAI